MSDVPESEGSIMTADFWPIMGLSIIGSVLALIGGVVFLTVKGWARTLASYSVPFAAGVLLSVTFLGLLPEAIHMGGEGALAIVLVAFLGSYLFEHVFFSLHHHDDERAHKGAHAGSIPLVIAGDTIHNLIDGVAIAAAYLVSPGLGVVTTISTFLHEVPHEIGDFGILLKAGWKRRRVFLVNLLSALATLLGAILVLLVSHTTEMIGQLMAVAAGMFLYLAASDFLPHAQEHLSQRKALGALLGGVAIMWLVLSLAPHSHGNDVDDHGHDEEEYAVIHEDADLDEEGEDALGEIEIETESIIEPQM